MQEWRIVAGRPEGLGVPQFPNLLRCKWRNTNEQGQIWASEYGPLIGFRNAMGWNEDENRHEEDDHPWAYLDIQ